MVFCDSGTFFRCLGKFIIIFRWFVWLFSGQSANGSGRDLEQERKQKTGYSVSPVSFTKGDMDDSRTCKFRNYDWKIRYTASFTVEAAMVLGIVFFCFALVLKQAYVLHDTVTGTMILEEMLENARVNQDENIESAAFAKQGEITGNPRLWLGEYRMEIGLNSEKACGKTYAGDWTQEMEIDLFRPGRFLRRCEAIKEIGKELHDGGSGVQEGNEPELYGHTSRAGAEGKLYDPDA